MPQSRVTGVNTPILTSDTALDLWRVTGRQCTEAVTIGSHHIKWLTNTGAQEPSKLYTVLYSAKHDQTQVDTIITVILPSSRSPARRRAWTLHIYRLVDFIPPPSLTLRRKIVRDERGLSLTFETEIVRLKRNCCQ